MKNSGLVSISFRDLSIEEIFDLCRQNHLEFIEWGGDVHCKAGDGHAIEKIRRLSKEYSIKACAYGSYYRVGVSMEEMDFDVIADTAKEIGADIIRVWAYNKGSAQVSDEEYRVFLEDLVRICGIAAKKDIKISLECHNNTLTDHYDSALRLINDADCYNLTMYWQPNQHKSYEYNLKSAVVLSKYITNVHVFNWRGNTRLSLNDGIREWRSYRDIIEKCTQHHHRYLLEFMPSNSTKEMPFECNALDKILL